MTESKAEDLTPEQFERHCRQSLFKSGMPADKVAAISADRAVELAGHLPAEFGLTIPESRLLTEEFRWPFAKLRETSTREARAFLAANANLPPSNWARQDATRF
jgi:hypothetical protein